MLAATLCLGLAQPGLAQRPALDLWLRDGQVLSVSQLRGDAERGFTAELPGGKQTVAASELLLLSGTAATVPDLPAVWLQGGDIVRGAVVGGDAGGNQLQVLSPVLGRLQLPVDRLAAIGAAGVVAPLQLRVPDGVDEALLLRAGIGFDVVAGTLHQFGVQGVRFEPEGGAPRWYAPTEFAALRLRGAAAPPPAAWSLLTRIGERLSVSAPRAGDEGLVVRLENGTDATIRWGDVACLQSLAGAVFASDLSPAEADERGCDGEVVMPWQRDHNVLGAPLVCAGRSCIKGLGVHAFSRLVFRVPDGCERFWTRVGYDDSVLALPLQPQCEVRIAIDGKVVFRRAELRAGAVLDPGVLAVRPGSTVALEVDFGGGRDLGDRVDWLTPVFLPPAVRKP